ncbi:MAG: hydrogenase maturation nickel metallochaperone HypA [bacterium]|nr:hydrogenase maturation nickel metallochaperone HypA [bacterium]
MHELALAQDIVGTIAAQISADLKKLAAINLEVGDLSGVVPESLDFGLRTILKETYDLEVLVNISRVPTIARCVCGQEYEVKQIFESCTSCQSFDRELVSGKDVVINSVEVSED